MNERKQRATPTTRCPVCYLERMQANSNNKKHMALFVIMNYDKQRAKQKTHVTLFVIVNECKQRAKQKARGTVCFHERR